MKSRLNGPACVFPSSCIYANVGHCPPFISRTQRHCLVSTCRHVQEYVHRMRAQKMCPEEHRRRCNFTKSRPSSRYRNNLSYSIRPTFKKKKVRNKHFNNRAISIKRRQKDKCKTKFKKNDGPNAMTRSCQQWCQLLSSFAQLKGVGRRRVFDS